MSDPRGDIEEWLSAIEREGVNLTTWEEDFIESMRANLDRGRELTDRQVEIVERIYTDRTP